MDKKITFGAVGGQVGVHDGHCHESCSEESLTSAPLDPAQAETIRGFAEHIVRLLCARHNGTPADQHSPWQDRQEWPVR